MVSFVEWAKQSKSGTLCVLTHMCPYIAAHSAYKSISEKCGKPRQSLRAQVTARLPCIRQVFVGTRMAAFALRLVMLSL